MHRFSPDTFQPRYRQRGQALIYGMFMLVCGSAALFFVFNTGQLTLEKTKLVNTADAVAYSAGVLHARALNFDAYTNRALMANEVMIAQTVSIASWVDYAQGHVDSVPPLNCYEVVYSAPFWLGLVEYLPLCVALSWPPGALAVQYAREAVQPVAEATVMLSEAARLNLQLAQAVMFASLVPARARLMQEVADANYRQDGAVKVDALPLTDQWLLFDGGPFITRNSGDDRARFREAAQTAAGKDAFVARRDWDSHSPWPCLLAPRGDAAHNGATTLEGYDDWKAHDSASLSVESWHIHLFSMGCETDASYSLGSGSQSAADWGYSGIPNFYSLSEKALAYNPANSDPDQRDPHLKFSIRLTRAVSEQRTSGGASAVRPSGKMAIYAGAQAEQVMAAVATSEVYFERPADAPRMDGKTELASLFNPYWQVRLSGNSAADIAKAVALQAGGRP
jgi:hypothetical protein